MSDALITGGTGFIGQALIQSITSSSESNDLPERLWVLTRDPIKWRRANTDKVRYIGHLDEIVKPKNLSVIVNLAGESLAAKRWNRSQKEVIYNSRVEFTRQLVNWAKERTSHLKLWLNGSAIGWYGHQAPETELSELSSGKACFSHDLCEGWENEAKGIADHTERLVLLRTGIVLEKHGGPLKAMLLPFKLGAGGPMGSGKQIWSWIHLDDLVSLIREIMVNPSYVGPVNGTAPTPLSQAEFAKHLGKAMHRPSFAPMPGFMAKMVIGEFAQEVLLTGQKVLPKKALDNGFDFKYADLKSALAGIFP